MSVEVSASPVRLDVLPRAQSLMVLNRGDVAVALSGEVAVEAVEPGAVVEVAPSGPGVWATATEPVAVLVAAGRVSVPPPPPDAPELVAVREKSFAALSSPDLDPSLRDLIEALLQYVDQQEAS